MSSKLAIPKFATEAEEADWIYANRHLVEAEISAAFDEGRMRKSSLVPPSARSSEPASVQLPLEDSERARIVAAKRQITLEKYLQMLIHEGVERDSNAA